MIIVARLTIRQQKRHNWLAILLRRHAFDTGMMQLVMPRFWRCAQVEQGFVQAQIKGKMFESSFHPDPEVYLANQHIVFGAPKIPAIATALSAAVPLNAPDTATA